MTNLRGHGEAERAKAGRTVAFVLTTLDVLGFSEDTDYQEDLGPEDVTDIRENIISQVAWDHIYDGKDKHEIVKGMLQHLQMSSPGGIQRLQEAQQKGLEGD